MKNAGDDKFGKRFRVAPVTLLSVRVYEEVKVQPVTLFECAHNLPKSVFRRRVGDTKSARAVLGLVRFRFRGTGIHKIEMASGARMVAC